MFYLSTLILLFYCYLFLFIYLQIFEHGSDIEYLIMGPREQSLEYKENPGHYIQIVSTTI